MTPERPGTGDTFDGTVEDVVMPDDVRAAAEARIERAVERYGDPMHDGAPIDG